MIITGCVITKNEENNIGKCLESLNNTCDEVVLVDTGSTDDTVKIAKEHGANIYYFDWIDDFSAAKNYAKSKATGDWIIFLDADEYFKDDNIDKKSFKKIISKRSKTHDAIACTIENLNSEGDVFSTHTVTRIFKNSEDIWFKGKIHENIYKNDSYVKVILATDLYIVHTGYVHEDVVSKNKFERNLKLLKKEKKEKPYDPKIYLYLGDTYGFDNNKIKQVEMYKKSIELGDLDFLKTESHYRERKIIKSVYKSNLSFKLKEYEMLKVYRNIPNDYYFNAIISGFYYDYRRYHDCIYYSDRALSIYVNQDIEKLLEYNRYTKALYQNRANSFLKLGKNNEALKSIIESIKLYNIENNFPKKNFLKLIKLVNNMEPIESIQLINSLIPLDSINILKELLTILVKVGNETLLAYYIKKLYEKENEKSIYIIYYNFYSKKFKMVIDTCEYIYMNNYDNDIAYLAFASAFIIDDMSLLKNISEYFGPSLYKFYINLTENKNYDIDLNEAYKIIKLLSNFNDIDLIFRLINCLPNNQLDIHFYKKIADEFINSKNLVLAEKIFNTWDIELGLIEQGKIDELRGIIYFYLGDYVKMLSAFKLALDRMNISTDIYEILTEVYNSTKNKEIKNILRNTPHVHYLKKYL